MKLDTRRARDGFARAHVGWYQFFFLLTVTPAAYGRSQASDRIKAAAEAYTTATAMADPSCLCNLHHTLGQHWILNPLRKARDWTCILINTGLVLNPLSRNGNSRWQYLSVDHIWRARFLPWRILNAIFFSLENLKFYSAWIYVENSSVQFFLSHFLFSLD